MKFADIVVNVPTFVGAHSPKEDQLDGIPPYSWLEQTFTYDVPPDLREIIRVGQMVWVPFGARRLQGIIVGLSDTTALESTRPIEDLVDRRPILSELQIELARWISRRYLAPLPDCVWLLLPPGIEEKVETIYQVAPKSPSNGDLSESQRELLERVRERGTLKSMRLAPAVRGTADSLVRQGYLIRRPHIKRPAARPKHVQAAKIIVSRGQADAILSTLVRRDTRGDIIEALSLAEAPLSLEELCSRARVQPAAVRGLARAGIVEIIPGQSTFALTSKYYETLPAVTPGAARVLVFLRENKKAVTFDQIYDATRTTPSTLRALQEKGLVEKNEASESVRLIASPPSTTRKSRVENVIDFLEREAGPVWISAIYAATGATLQDLRKLERAGIVELETKEQMRDPLGGRQFVYQDPPNLTAEQQLVLNEIQSGFESGTPCVHLLHGVTGSGKTEIYIRAIETVVAQGKQAIALVPEIALAPQTIARFGARFRRIGVIHSELSYGERYDTWRRARDGQLDVVIGPRSALFAPLPKLGLIVIDEEHEPSYKQEPDAGIRLPPYHTRQVALELAARTRATMILGSATPDVETYFRALQGEFKLVELPQRILAHGPGEVQVQFQDLPPVQVVDMRAELRAGNTSIFSRALSGGIRDALGTHQQIILFLNRRGSATSVVCRNCGESVKCSRCNNPYTLHHYGLEAATELVCHHCGKRSQMPRLCPNCGSPRVRGLGLGTEKLEQTVREIFPEARTIRWDWDVTRGKEAHEKILEAFTRGEADVLVGTQMIAKGLDLPRVTLVGIVNADLGLNLPDFRASERTFQLLTQVAGRAGRSALGGQVILQTYHPEHYAIARAARHDYKGFYEQELAFRREAGYPPSRRLARMLFASTSEAEAQTASSQLAQDLRDRIRREGLLDVQVIGPAPAYYSKLGGRYRYHLLLRGNDTIELLSRFPLPPGWRLDVDPINML